MNKSGSRVGSASLVVVSADIPLRHTLKHAVQKLLGGFLWRVRTLILVGAHCT